ncbi:unknown [Parabacteroides sp. CAG:409]|nr:unknown [Parabacteroides sp. CAG:409]
MEKRILCLILTNKFLYIIQQQDINALVKIQEIIYVVFTNSICKLGTKQMCRYIQHLFIGMQFLNPITYCMTQMGFTHTRCTKNKHRIKGSLSRILGNSLTG